MTYAKKTFKFVHKLPANNKRIYEDGKRFSRLENNGDEPIKDLVSIVTVCLNASQTIQQTIHSILSQTYPHIEHIVIDGCSTDGTIDILKENIEHLECFISEPNDGLFQALNKGISLARGEYVLILNAYDWHEIETVETVETLILAIKHSYADFVSVRAKLVDESGECIGKIPSIHYDSSMYFDIPVRHGLMLLPRQLYAKTGCYNEHYCFIADFDLKLRLFNAGYTFYEVPKFLSNFRLTDISSFEFKRTHEEHIEIIKTQFSYISDKNATILANEKSLTQDSLDKIASLYQDKPKLMRALWTYACHKEIQTEYLQKIVDKIITPDISIIIPVYNSQNVVERCVQSILTQNNVSLEVIIIDDKSADESPQVLQTLKNNDSRIRIFHNRQNLGAAASRNIGIEKAQGKYVFFVDSDDEIPTDSLCKLYSAARLYHSSIVKGNMAYFSEQSGISQLKGYEIKEELVNVTVKSVPDLLKTTEGHITCLYETGFIKNTPYPTNLTVGEDSLFLIKAMLRADKITLLPIVVYHYIDNNNSAINNYALQQYIDECHWRLSTYYLLNFYGFGDIGSYLVKDYWNETAFSKLADSLSDKEYAIFANSYLELVRETKVFPDKNNLNIPKTAKLFANILESYGSQMNKKLLYKTANHKSQKELKLAIVTTTVTGGAGIAAKRLFDSLQVNESLGVDLFTRQNIFITSNCFPQDQLVNTKYTNTHFSLEKDLIADYGSSVTACEAGFIEDLQKYDVINIHWSADFTSHSFLKALVNTGRPIIFTLHDYWMFTGGCHFPAGCQGYIDSACVRCPQIKKDQQLQNSVQQSLKSKHDILKKPNVFVIAPSHFLLDALKKCSLQDIEKRTFMVRNPYVPLSSEIKKQRKSKSFVLICDTHKERRKGFDLACEALTIILKNHCINEISVAVIGDITEREKQKLANIRNITYFGKISDYRKINYIFETHEFILQSSFEDNWPNVLVEAGVAGCIPIVMPNHGCEEFTKRFVMHDFVSKEVAAQSYATTINMALDTSAKKLGSIRTQIRTAVGKEHQQSEVADAFQQIISKTISICKEKLDNYSMLQDITHVERKKQAYSYYANKLKSKAGWKVQENEFSFLATILGLMSHYEPLTLELRLLNSISGVQTTEIDIEFITHKKNEEKQVFSLNYSKSSGWFTVKQESIISIVSRKKKNIYGIMSFIVKSIKHRPEKTYFT